MAEPVIQVENVSMMFNLNNEKIDNLKEYMIKMATGKLRYNEFWALKDINFTVEKGDRLGVMGLNGAVKHCLKLQVMKPTQVK